MKIRTTAMILTGLAFILSAPGCGDNAEGDSVSLVVSTEQITWKTGNPEMIRVTDWITYTTWQRKNQPYDAYEEFESLIDNVEIIFTVSGSNEAFDDPWLLDEQGERINPVLFIDMDGNEQTSPFITKTDDTGRYILGVSTLLSGCIEYGVDLEARVMGETARTRIEVESGIDDAFLPLLCSGE